MEADELHCGAEVIIPIDIQWIKCKLCGRECRDPYIWIHLPYCSEMCKQVAAREG